MTRTAPRKHPRCFPYLVRSLRYIKLGKMAVLLRNCAFVFPWKLFTEELSGMCPFSKVFNTKDQIRKYYIQGQIPKSYKQSVTSWELAKKDRFQTLTEVIPYKNEPRFQFTTVKTWLLHFDHNNTMVFYHQRYEC